MADLRVQPPSGFDKLFDLLTGPEGAFERKADVLLFAAALGWSRRSRQPFEKGGEGIRFDIFRKHGDDAFISSLAVWEVKDLNVLRDDRMEERIRIFQEYAHGGLVILDEKVMKQSGGVMDCISDLIIAASQEGDDAAELPGIQQDILEGFVGD